MCHGGRGVYMSAPPSVNLAAMLNTVTTNNGGAIYGSKNYRLH